MAPSPGDHDGDDDGGDGDESGPPRPCRGCWCRECSIFDKHIDGRFVRMKRNSASNSVLSWECRNGGGRVGGLYIFYGRVSN